MMDSRLNNIILLLRRHFVAVFLSAAIGLVVAAPQVLFIYNTGSSYRGISMTGADAELHYLARMQESLDSGSLGNPFVYEDRDRVPSTIYTLSETILAFPARVFGISVSNLSLFYKFLLPLIVALLVYGLAFRLIKNKLWSIAVMFLTVLGSTLLNLPDVVHLLGWEKIYTQFALYSRPVNPEFSSILFLVYLHTLLTVLRRKTWKWLALLSVLFGLSFYVYLYSYTFFLTLNLITILACMIKREWRLSLGVLLATIGGAVLGSLSILNTIKLYGHPSFKDMAAVSDIVISHHPIISIVGIITVAVFLVFAFKYKEYPDLTFLGILLATAFVVVNQQIVTGILIQQGHYHWYFNIPIFILVLVVAGFYLVGRSFPTVGATIVILVCGAALISALLIQTSSYEYWYGVSRANQRYAPVLSWLKEHSQKESVVLADQSLSELIPVYTSDNVVWESHAAFYLLSPERRDFTPDRIMSAPSLKKVLMQYRVDYLVWDSEKEPDWKLDTYSFLNKKYDDGEFKIYVR